MTKKKETTIEDLSVMIAKGFEDTATKSDIKRLDERISRLDHRMNERLIVIERDIAEIRSHFVYRDEFEDLAERMKYIELKLGIESGK